MTAYQAPQNTNTPEPVAHAGPVVWSLAIAVLSFSLMQTLLVPALPELSRAFDLDAASGGWILTTYLLAGAVAAPILGALGDRYGHKRLLLISLGFFVVGSIFALVAPSFGTLLAARVLQGASTATFPLALAIVRSDLMPTAQPAAMGWLSGMLGAGAGAALVIGGVVTDFIGWRWLFSIGAIMGLLSMALIVRWVPRSQPKGGGRIDLAGAALLTVGLVTLLLALTQGNAWGWASIGVLSLVAAAVVSFAAFVIVERAATVPLMNLRSRGSPLRASSRCFSVRCRTSFTLGFPCSWGRAAASVTASRSRASASRCFRARCSSSLVAARRRGYSRSFPARSSLRARSSSCCSAAWVRRSCPVR
ncbi:MFS transporter [Leucobacter sp. UCMA 4100]|uniref:MFS transporter n=1 Tax=Leucobacter sp. UCMA 4100 TaxID=2810534 RepID=UPI0022EA9767|nr:MFS transporter [Leucobacter sp. UCMA 4100]MDA3147613.1 MFS transporter [Leucobacter sp. UCMA 4100]